MLLICINELKEEVETVNEKLQELTEEEIAQVNGGASAVGAQDGMREPQVIEPSDKKHIRR